MKETKLGDFEETILLLVGILNDEAYAFRIAEEFEAQTERAVSIGAVHSTLNRLERKASLLPKWGQPLLKEAVEGSVSIPLQQLAKKH